MKKEIINKSEKEKNRSHKRKEGSTKEVDRSRVYSGCPDPNQITLRPFDGYQATPETIYRVGLIAKMLGEGKSRATIQNWIMDNWEVGDRQARALYTAALRMLTPSSETFDEERRGLIQANLDRLEKIVESSIDGNLAEKRLAKECISEMNKVLLGTNQTQVILHKDKEKDEFIIQLGND